MMYDRLISLQKPILASVVGAGNFGAEMVTQIAHISNMEVAVLCDLDTKKAKNVYIEAGYSPTDIVFAETALQANVYIEQGKRVIMDNSFEMTLTAIDVVCDATGEPYFGAELAYKAITAGKHTVVINIESDVGAGSALHKLAQKNNVIYTEADGDQPSLINGLFDWCRCLGIDVIAAGKWTTLLPEELWADKVKRTDSGYADGSKNQVEMCCVANMTGLLPDKRGMHKPSLILKDIPEVFCTKGDGGIFESTGVVDVVNCLSPDGKTVLEGVLSGGVFVVAQCDNPRFDSTLYSKNVLHSKNNKRALLYRPYHMVGIEAPISIMRAVLYNEATGAPLKEPVAEVVAIAKRDLKKGDRLDGIGGKTVRGEIERVEVLKNNRYLPLCLAEDVVLNTDVSHNTPITMDMLESPGQSFMWKLKTGSIL